MMNTDECSDAASKIVYYGGQISINKTSLEKRRTERDALQQRLSNTVKQKSEQRSEQKQVTQTQQSLEERIESLRCRFCIEELGDSLRKFLQ